MPVSSWVGPALLSMFIIFWIGGHIWLLREQKKLVEDLNDLPIRDLYLLCRSL
jgi:hypothetical protein